nr:hypothetical protein [Tanacetum cinerariifolium]
MAAYVIPISLDLSEERVGFFISSTRVTIGFTFLCSDDSEADNESKPTEQRPEKHESRAVHDAMVSSTNGPHKFLAARKRVGPFPARRLAWRRVSHRLSDRHSSPDFTSDSSSLDTMHQARLIQEHRLELHHLGTDITRIIRKEPKPDKNEHENGKSTQEPECLSCGALYTTNCYCSDGSLGDKIICDLNKTTDLSQRPPQNCPKCGNPVDDSSEPSNDITNVVNALQEPFVVKQDPGENSSQSAHYGYNCQPKVLIIPDPEPFNNQTIDELPQTLPSFNPTCYSGDGNSFTYDSKSNIVGDSPNVFDPPPQPPVYLCEFCENDALTPILSTEEPDNSLSMGDEHLDTLSAMESDEFIKSSVENLVLIPSESKGIPDNMCDVPFHDNFPPLDVSKDQFEDFFDSNNDSTSIDDDSFSIDNIEYVEASPPNSELVSLEVMEIVIPEVGGIDADILLTIKDDILREKLLNINLLIANIKALKDNPAPSFDFITKSSSTSLNSLLEETNTFDNSLPESETFCFDLEEIRSGSTTTRSGISLLDYEAFYDDHVKEISSGSTTTHFNSSLYDSFIFDLSINPFLPAGRSDFDEFADELAHIISLPEYDCFCFKNEPNSGDFTMDVVEDIFPTIEPSVHVHNVLPTHLNLQLNLDFILSSESLFAYVVWIFLPFLSYLVAPKYLLSFENEDTIFDPGIYSYHISSFKPDVSHRSGTFMKINAHPKHLNESPMKILISTCFPMDQ